MKSLDINALFSEIDTYWLPKTVAELNEYHVQLIKVNGEFEWHGHPDMDKLFIVIEGELLIDFESEVVTISKGEMFVVPGGLQHKPYTYRESQLMLVAPKNLG